jgi:hypothetical protein
MMVTKRDVQRGAVIGPENFTQVLFTGEEGERLHCPEDGAPFAHVHHHVDGRSVGCVFTREGWV